VVSQSGNRNSAVVEMRGVEKSFGERAVLRGVDLIARKGENLVIIGRSGSGKSVTLRHIVGLELPDAGEVVVLGKDMSRATAREQLELRLRLGFLFQSGALLNWMTVEENVALPLVVHHPRMTPEEIETRVIERLRLVGLENDRKKLPGDISGGMKKRASLARATVLDPEIILYDEPTSGLDPVISSAINDLIVHTREVLGATQIVVTHDMESAFRIGDRIAMLYGGRIIASGSPDEIRGSENEVVRQFISGKTEGPLGIDS
jgi:phospholipid/cholesterol/gamma-HCH transport system ATP-binding protein